MKAAKWRVGLLSMTTLCGAAGAGLLLSAATMQPPRPPQPQAAARPASHAPAPAPSSPAAASSVAASAPPTASATPRPSIATSMPRAEPVRIEIPAIAVKADLLSLGIDSNGELAVPPFAKAHMASWYNLGPSPGEIGSAIIVGHVDSEKTGPAVFFNLGKLKPGDVIKVHRKDGTVAEFTVDGVKSFLKAEFPAEQVYGGDDRAMLKLVTCGGQYDKKNRNYLSNVVAFASYQPPSG